MNPISRSFSKPVLLADTPPADPTKPTSDLAETHDAVPGSDQPEVSAAVHQANTPPVDPTKPTTLLDETHNALPFDDRTNSSAD